MEPLTPNNQLSFSESVKLAVPVPASPTKSRAPDAGVEKQNAIRPNLGFQNNPDMFVCPINPFITHYGPCDVKTMIGQTMARLARGEGCVLGRKEDGSYYWVDFEVLPKDSGMHEDDTFAPLEKIAKAILGEKTNKLHFKLVPNTKLTSDIEGSTHKIDACFIDGRHTGSPLPNRKIGVPIEVKKYRHKLIRALAHLQILGACNHILNEDVRRMWSYGLTFENSMASVWYFSRGHSVKSVAFDWIQHPELLVEVLLMFARATPEQLGFDPTIHIGPASKKGKGVSFVYEVLDKDNKKLYFKTGRSLVPQRPVRIAGRTTRVWEVTQVTAADGKREVSGKKVILKDVWLDESDKYSMTEAQNMDAIFEAIDKMVVEALDKEIALELESNPETTREELLADPDIVKRLTMQFINRDTRFDAFDEAAKGRLRDNLTGTNYRSLFLTKLYAWEGKRSEVVCPDAWRSPTLFHPNPIDEKRLADELQDEYAKKRGMGVPDSSVQTLSMQLENTQINAAREANDKNRLFPPKRQSRFIYEEVCTTLQNLATVGDVVDVLCQTVDALHILFAAGWVHRDISSNNIMAYRSGDDQPWVMKLADLEFSRLMIDPERKPRSDPRTGTAFFMPVEIQAEKHFFQRYLLDTGLLVDYTGSNLAMSLGLDESSEAYKSLSRLKEIPVQYFEVPLASAIWHKAAVRRQPVVHNYQHDLESVWWVLLWIITCRVGCPESVAATTKLFQHDVKNFKARERQFSKYLSAIGDALLTELQHFSLPADFLRARMYSDYMVRPIVGHLELPESYSAIHALFATQLRELQATEGPWRTLKLQGSKVATDTDSALPSTVTGKRAREAVEVEPRRSTRLRTGDEN